MSAAVQSNSALIATYLEALIRKDAAAVDKYFHPDVEYVVNGVEAQDRTCLRVWRGDLGREPGGSLWLVPPPRPADRPNSEYFLFDLL